eukprot:3834758-Rhodomonas_salina.2
MLLAEVQDALNKTRQMARERENTIQVQPANFNEQHARSKLCSNGFVCMELRAALPGSGLLSGPLDGEPLE